MALGLVRICLHKACKQIMPAEAPNLFGVSTHGNKYYLWGLSLSTEPFVRLTLMAFWRFMKSWLLVFGD